MVIKMVTYSISKTNANIGETITLSRSENLDEITFTFWIIDLQPSDYSSTIPTFYDIGKMFVVHSVLSTTVTINDNHTIAHTLTPISISPLQSQSVSSMYTTPIYQLQGRSDFTVDIGKPIKVNFNRNIYNQLKFLVNRWTKGKENTSNKVTSISSSSTDTQYPSAKCVYDKCETKIDKLQKSVTTFNPIDYVVGENGAVWNNDNNITLPNNGSNISFNFTDMLNETGDYFEWELRVSDGTTYMRDEEHSDEIWNSSENSSIRIRITKNQGSDSYHIITTDLSNNTIIKDYDKDYQFNLKFGTMNRCTFYFSSKKWYHTVSFIDMIYPIGSIYMSVNSINPSLFIGGTWEQIEDRFLLASGNTYTNGSTGGSATVTLTANQSGVPQHTHTYAHTDTTYKLNTTNRKPGTSTAVAYGTSITATANNTTKTSNNNTSQNATESHNNMPPYLAVYMWERVG